MATYTRPIAATFLASGLAGTLGYTVKSAAGATLIARTTAGIAEDGTSGVYSANVPNWDTSWSGAIRWDDGAGNVAVETFLAYAPGVLDNVPLKSDLLQASDVTAAAAAALPANFTSGTFSAPGVFAAAALANAPAGSGGGSGPTAAQIADAVLSRPFPGSPPADSVAGILGDLPTLDEYRDEIAGTPALDALAGMVESSGGVDRFKASALALAPAGGGSGGGGGLTQVQAQAACAAAIAVTPVSLKLTQPLADVTAGTVGGALHGAWATAWGKMTKDRVNRLLRQFGIGSQSAPAKVFALDNADNPTTKVPQ